MPYGVSLLAVFLGGFSSLANACDSACETCAEQQEGGRFRHGGGRLEIVGDVGESVADDALEIDPREHKRRDPLPAQSQVEDRRGEGEDSADESAVEGESGSQFERVGGIERDDDGFDGKGETGALKQDVRVSRAVVRRGAGIAGGETRNVGTRYKCLAGGTR